MMISCHEMTRLQSQSQDRALSWSLRLKMQVHCALCLWCRRYRDQLDFIRRSLRIRDSRREENSGESLTPEFRARLKQSLRRGDDESP
jgi:hypothetical protein